MNVPNESPAIRKIWEGVTTLIENGHPNVPGLLRRIAKDIEEEAKKPVPLNKKVIMLPGCSRKDITK